MFEVSCPLPFHFSFLKKNKKRHIRWIFGSYFSRTNKLRKTLPHLPPKARVGQKPQSTQDPTFTVKESGSHVFVRASEIIFDYTGLVLRKVIPRCFYRLSKATNFDRKHSPRSTWSKTNSLDKKTPLIFDGTRIFFRFKKKTTVESWKLKSGRRCEEDEEEYPRGYNSRQCRGRTNILKWDPFKP